MSGTKKIISTCSNFDLRFKLLWCKDEEEKKEMKIMLTKHIAKFSPVHSAEEECTEHRTEDSPPKKAENFFIHDGRSQKATE